MTLERCFKCGGPYHEATGHRFAGFESVVWGRDPRPLVYCGACFVPFLGWMKGHLKRKWSKGAFYDEAATSVRAGVFPLNPFILVDEGGMVVPGLTDWEP